MPLISIGGALILMSGADRRFSTETFSMLYSLAYYVPFMLAPVMLRTLRGEGRTETLRLNPISGGTTLRIVFIALLGVSIVSNIDVFWRALWQKLGLNVFLSAYVRPANTAELTLSILNVSLLVPVCEELLFRGVILTAWEDRGRRAAVAVSAAMFAMLHGSLLGVPGQLYGGVIMALLVLWTDSLYASIIYHSVFNGAASLMNYANTAATATDPAAEALLQSDIIGALGGPSVLLVLLLDTALMLFVVRMLMRGLKMFDAMRRSGAEVGPDGKLRMSEKLQERMRGIAIQQMEDRRAGRKPQPFVPPQERVCTDKLRVSEKLMLGAGAGVVLVLYLADILAMLGG